MIAARQEAELRLRLERLDRLVMASEGIAAGALTFAFRPLWQLDAGARAALALSKAQATAVYAMPARSGTGLRRATSLMREAKVDAVAVTNRAGCVALEGPTASRPRRPGRGVGGRPRRCRC